MKLAFFTDNYMPGRSVLDPFRRELVLSLAERCSELLLVQTNDYLEDSGQPLTKMDESHLISRVREFRPELVISLNRAGLNPVVADAIQAPIASWYIDNPNRCPDLLRHYTPGERIYCANRFGAEWVNRNLKGVQARTHYLPFCTNDRIFTPDTASPDSSGFCDVSFVSTLWDPSTVMSLAAREFADPLIKKRFQEGLIRYLSQYDFDLHAEVADVLPKDFTQAHFKNLIDDFISTQRRLEILGRLADLKLEVYGTATWIPYSLLTSPLLYQAFRTDPIQTPEQLASLYRRTRVGLSIAHHQSQSGFPIRIFDLLGSGLPLVTDRHSELNELFEEGRMFLSYGTPDEARECVQSLLRDPKRAANMSSTAVDAIRGNHTFAHRSRSLMGTESVARISNIEIVSENLDPRVFAESPGTRDCRIQQSPRAKVGTWQVAIRAPVHVDAGLRLLKKVTKHSAILVYRFLKFVSLVAVLGSSVLLSRRERRTRRVYGTLTRDIMRDFGFGTLLLLARANHELKKTIRDLHTSDS